MRNIKTKNAAKAVIFVLIFAIIICSCTRVFAAKWYDKNSETAIAKHFYELKEDSIEVLLLGSSQVTWSIDSVEFYEKYGISTYSIGGSHNNLFLNYYWLQEALKHQRNIKTVMLDVSYVYNTDADEAADYLKNIQGMKWGRNKYNAVRDYYNTIDTDETKENSFFDVIINYIFTLNRYHMRWSDIDKVDFNDEEYDINNVMGYTPTANVWKQGSTYEEFIIDNDKGDASDIFKPIQAEYLEKIISSCKQNNINIVLIKTPKRSWSKTGSDYVSKLAKEEGVDFLECTSDEVMKKTGIDYDRDFMDPDHLNARGAKKLADYLCEYLISHGEYTDVRKSKAISDKNLEIYHKKLDDCYLNSSITPEEYLNELQKRDYTIILQSSKDISDVWTDELQKGLEASGFKLKIAQQKGKNYVTAVKNGEVIIEKSQKEMIEEKIKVVPSNNIKVISDFKDSVTQPKFSKELEYSKEGLRITVFDKDSGATLSRATIYSSDGSLKIAVEKTY